MCARLESHLFKRKIDLPKNETQFPTPIPGLDNTGNDVYSGDRYSGNDRYSGLKPPDDAILFTVSGITAIADKKLEILTIIITQKE